MGFFLKECTTSLSYGYDAFIISLQPPNKHDFLECVKNVTNEALSFEHDHIYGYVIYNI